MGWGYDGENLSDPRTLLEEENGLRQARLVADLIRDALVAPDRFRLTVKKVCKLNRVAMNGLIPTAGRIREGSDLVRAALEETCAFVHERWSEDPLFLAAYVAWRVSRIRPFEDGNARTARAAAYLVLGVRLGSELPGRAPMPARIERAPIAYTKALEAADAAWAKGTLDLSVLQELFGASLKAQLEDAP